MNPTESTTDSTAPRRRIALITIALGLALAVVGAVLLVVPERSAGVEDDPQDVAIVAQATRFATEYNTYDATDADDYTQRLAGVLTKEFAETNQQTTEAFFKVLAPKKQKSTDPQVKAVAVQSGDADSAKVLVAVDATVSNSDLKGSELRQMRWLVSMVREDGEWRVDAYESVAAQPANGQPAPATTGTPTPSATPTPSQGAGDDE